MGRKKKSTSKSKADIESKNNENEQEFDDEDEIVEPEEFDEKIPEIEFVSSSIDSQTTNVISNYLKQLSYIPLFTPEQELEAAKKLVELEIEAWYQINKRPRAVEILSELYQGDQQTKKMIAGLLRAYKADAKKENANTIEFKPSKRRDNTMRELATYLRYEDIDKILYYDVIKHCRREVWGKTSKKEPPRKKIGQLNRAGLLQIEKARGASVRFRNNFVRANLRLVVSVARGFHHVHLSLIDLIQEGNFGLLKAVHRFDYRKGFRFSTYAHWWIRQAIERAIVNKGNEVRLPVHVIDTKRQISKAAALLFHEYNREPTLEEIARHLKISVEKLEASILSTQTDPVSLDDPVSEEDARRLVDLVRDENQLTIDEAVIRENTYTRLKELMTNLSDIEKDVIRRRFGLNDGREQTLDEIGKSYGLSRERVRQVQAQGLAKMRRMCERRSIRNE